MNHPLTLYNTLTKKKELFIPLGDAVTLYNCGPTVYHDQHIGNFRTSISVDILKRTLLYFGYAVKHITNITDVGHLTNDAEDSGEDKIAVGARREGLTAKQVARKYEKQYKEGIRALGILPPLKWTRATEHIPEQIRLIEALEQKGFTYQTGDGVYFDSQKFPHYGELAGLSLVQQQAGKRVAMGEKRSPTDFALWKFAASTVDRQMEWKSPWGVGFPGWHIECSAMAMKYLGETIDIHCGAIDLIPVHHTNEIAQSEAATGKKFVRYWMHGAFVLEGTEKMSKSKGVIKTLEWVTEQGFSAMDYRYLTLQTHYRKELNVTVEALTAAHVALRQICEFILGAPQRGGHIIESAREEFDAALADDLGIPRAVAVLWSVLNGSWTTGDKRKTILHFDAVLGLGLRKQKKVFDQIPEAVLELAEKRNLARSEKNWNTSDELRKKIRSLGFDVLDTPSGQTLKRVVY